MRPASSRQGRTLRFLKAFKHWHSRSTSSTGSSLTPGSGVAPLPSMPNAEQGPAWLINFLTDKNYRARVLEELTEREQLRAEYRSVSYATLPTPSSSAPMSLPSHTKPITELSTYYSTSKASSSENGSNNRYFDVLPYDRHAISVNVDLSDTKGSSRSKNAAYLNASRVKESSGDIWWIAAQGTVGIGVVFKQSTLRDDSPNILGSGSQ
jgi:hypothetical protein